MNAKDAMEVIMELLNEPRPPGTYWAHEVLERKKQGLQVSPAAVEMAKNALERSVGKIDT